MPPTRLLLPHRLLRPTRQPFLRLYSSSFQQSPSPPRLPQAQQEEFERLQRLAEAALSSHTSTTTIPSETSPATPATSSPRHVTSSSSAAAEAQPSSASRLPKTETQQEFSGGIRKGAPPEFEGEVNPKTGEVGGPKNEPLRWGDKGDWSYNGRVTDF
ncbi:hypothetical protein QBC42DRAFT_280240 [Cladorrhinum samala]|uniref:Succinate dehydrogenase assembly factor 4, mitochondrial n=1 Tax=Cladorrhinum samala TaxID=585594 RepID=A0AAV9HA44_9PEZI|nr:hypothetical protein QBC42DRAFT_280240 [Cladorrhinum samala]